MPLTRWRRQHWVRLPGGWKAPIVYWSERTIKRDMGKNPERFKGREVDMSGYWDGEKIVINTDEPLWVQVEVLGHEYGHAVHDWDWWLRLNVVQPMKQEVGQTLSDLAEEDE